MTTDVDTEANAPSEVGTRALLQTLGTLQLCIEAT
jgi:hypothetical protein